MPATKIQDEQEVLGWFREGWTYQQMSAEYRRKYDIEMTATAWGNFRHRRGLPRRQAMDDALVPWLVRPEHRNNYLLSMLRMESRRVAGLVMREVASRKLTSWKSKLAARGQVVTYDPGSTSGFSYVPRQPEDGDGLIRQPARSTRIRRPVDC